MSPLDSRITGSPSNAESLCGLTSRSDSALYFFGAVYEYAAALPTAITTSATINTQCSRNAPR